MPLEITNPRFFPGNISGLGMQYDDNGRAVDTRYGINIDTTNGCLIQHPGDDGITIAYAVDGQLDDTADRVRSLWLLTPDVTARVIGELAAMLQRADPDAATSLIGHLADQVTAPPDGADGTGDETPDDRLDDTVERPSVAA